MIIIVWKGCKFFAAPGVERHLPLARGLCLYTFDGSRSHIREVAKYERRQSKGDDKSTVGGRSRLARAPGPAGGGGVEVGQVQSDTCRFLRSPMMTYWILQREQCCVGTFDIHFIPNNIRRAAVERSTSSGAFI